MAIAGIDYSLTSPAICVFSKTGHAKFRFETAYSSTSPILRSTLRHFSRTSRVSDSSLSDLRLTFVRILVDMIASLIGRWIV